MGEQTLNRIHSQDTGNTKKKHKLASCSDGVEGQLAWEGPHGLPGGGATPAEP